MSSVQVFPDRSGNGDWRVENTDADGEGSCEVAIFSGPRAEKRARRFAKFEYGVD